MFTDLIIEIIKYCDNPSYHTLCLVSKGFRFLTLKYFNYNIVVVFQLFRRNLFEDRIIDRNFYNQISLLEYYICLNCEINIVFSRITYGVKMPKRVPYSWYKHYGEFDNDNIKIVFKDFEMCQEPPLFVCIKAFREYENQSNISSDILKLIIKNSPHDILDYIDFECEKSKLLLKII